MRGVESGRSEGSKIYRRDHVPEAPCNWFAHDLAARQNPMLLPVPEPPGCAAAPPVAGVGKVSVVGLKPTADRAVDSGRVEIGRLSHPPASLRAVR